MTEVFSSIVFWRATVSGSTLLSLRLQRGGDGNSLTGVCKRQNKDILVLRSVFSNTDTLE